MEKELTLFSANMLQEATPICEVFVKSGIFDDIKDVAQAIVKVLAGREIGLSPLESMMNLYIVKNRVAANSKVVSSLIKKSKTYDYIIEKLDNEECIISFTKDGKELGYELRKAISHAEIFSKIGAKKSRELVDELSKLEKMKPEIAVRIADVLPLSNDEIRTIYAKERYTLSEDELKQILDLVVKFE